MQGAIREARELLDMNTPDGDLAEATRPLVFVDRALVAAVEGRSDAVMPLLRRFERESGDWPAIMGLRDHMCATLGLAALAEQAAACLRKALSVPSSAMDFWDPYRPHYDAIRESASFQALLAELAAQ
ncbi:MAG: hypothetical protein AB8F65_06965 [Woeseiaceae bacterium]